MTMPKPLTRQQLAVLDELFDSDANEQDVLKTCKVESMLFSKWLTEPAFIEQFDKHIAAARRRSLLHLARCAPKAASRLVALSDQDKGETARKACLDIISGCDLSPTADQRRETKHDGRETSDHLNPEIASRLLAALAEATTDKQCVAKAETPDVIPSKAEAQKRESESVPQKSLL